MKSIDGIAVPNTAKKTSVKKKPAAKKPAKVVDAKTDDVINKKSKEKNVAKNTTVDTANIEAIEKKTRTVKSAKVFKPVKKADFSLDTQKEKNLTEKEKLKAAKKQEKLRKKEEKKQEKLAKKEAKKQKKLEKKENKKDKTTKKQEKSEEKPKKDKKISKKTSKTRIIITSILLVIVAAMIGVVVWAILWGNDLIAKMTAGQGNVLDLFSFLDDHYEPLKTDANGRTNILAFGTSGYDMNGSEGGGSHAGWSLADSIMMISISQENGNIATSTLPRDLRYWSYRCTATAKINEVYYCATRVRGLSEDEAGHKMMEEIGSVFGVEFQYYVHVNWNSLISIVNTLGGITVTLDENVNDWYYTGAKFQAGVPTTINGDQALALARARHGTSTGDFARGKNQQALLVGIKNKIYEKNLSLIDILGLANSLGDNLRTNLSIQELKTAAKLTFEFDFNNIKTLTLLDYTTGVYLMRTANINGISYVIPSAGDGNWSAVQAFIREQLNILNNEKSKTYQELIEEEQNAAKAAEEAAAENTENN